MFYGSRFNKIIFIGFFLLLNQLIVFATITTINNKATFESVVKTTNRNEFKSSKRFSIQINYLDNDIALSVYETIPVIQTSGNLSNNFISVKPKLQVKILKLFDRNGNMSFTTYHKPLI